MKKGRGSAAKVSVMGLIVMFLVLLQGEYSEAASYVVGGLNGWTFNAVSWPTGKQFRAGDVLVFKYNPGLHNVVAVDKGGYTNCKTPQGSKVYTSGTDRITLSKGQHFFICNFPGHCENNMKIALTVT